MPVQIGAQSHSFSEPTGLLSDCHRRVEMFMDSLQNVANRADHELTEDTRRALDLALRYFREAAPKHMADEEDSLFPRLRKINDPELQAALCRLDELEADHRWAEPLHAKVEQLGNQYLAEGRLSPDDARGFRDTVDRLQHMYRRHIKLEDHEVFPIASKLLTADLKQQIAREMENRRGLGSGRPVQLK